MQKEKEARERVQKELEIERELAEVLSETEEEKKKTTNKMAKPPEDDEKKKSRTLTPREMARDKMNIARAEREREKCVNQR